MYRKKLINISWNTYFTSFCNWLKLQVCTALTNQNKMCLWNTNDPNSKDGQGHKDKYHDTSRKILSQEMLMCNMKALIFII